MVSLIANVIGQLFGAVLRHGLGWSFIQTPGVAAGASVVGCFVIHVLASKQRAKSDAAK